MGVQVCHVVCEEIRGQFWDSLLFYFVDPSDGTEDQGDVSAVKSTCRAKYKSTFLQIPESHIRKRIDSSKLSSGHWHVHGVRSCVYTHTILLLIMKKQIESIDPFL